MDCLACGLWPQIENPVWEGVNGLCNACSVRRIAYDVAGMKVWGKTLRWIPVKVRRNNLLVGTCGCSYFDNPRITINVDKREKDVYHVIMVVVHEFAHQAAFRANWNETGHGPGFQAIEKKAYEAILGQELIVLLEDGEAAGGTGIYEHRYAQSMAFMRMLKEQHENCLKD